MSALDQIDAAVDRAGRLRDELLANPSAVNRAERLALLFASEARAWSQLFEVAETRPVWRAALVAEQQARRHAAWWSKQARSGRLAPERQPISSEV
ncbi:hypothetical protein [Pseudonocardia pini]|uniref:hypothetical protein n=1 Tax=Pseudonocardia pini TaxID=2758030 RepID=UPI0015F078EE|nr:hypothetical protein [Pseudonocardia pini]